MRTGSYAWAVTAALLTAQGSSHAASDASKPSDPPLTDAQIAQRIQADYSAIDASKFPLDYYFLTSLNPHPTGGKVDQYIYKNAGLPPPASASKGPPSCALSPHLFIRHDRLDTFQLREQNVSLSSAKGASISGTDDERASTETLVVNGRVEYLLFGDDAACEGSQQTANPDAPAYGYAFAPFIDAQGTIDTPAKKTDVHDLQAGFDLQMNVLNGPLFDDQYFILTPYYQTDFDGVAQVQGVTASWEPVNEDIHLGGYSGSPGPYVGWYWQLQTQFDDKHVTTVGYTGLTKGNYEWLGGTVQAHFNFFPSQGAGNPYYVSPDPWLEDRFYMNLTLKSFLNAADDRSATWFEGELGYNLTTDGKSSVSVKYDLGTDKDTLITSKKYLLAINFKN